MLDDGAPGGDLRARMRRFYGSSQTYKGLLDAHDEAYSAPYVDLVLRYAGRRTRVLELGGGNGVAARMLADAGLAVVGTDLSPLFLREAGASARPALGYAVCDGFDLPFADESFDIVCSNEYLEHVPDAEAALDEMARVTLPGGRVMVMGPNLCSPFLPFREGVLALRGRRDGLIWTDGPRDAWRQTRRNIAVIADKKRRSEPQFLHRAPDLEDRIIGGDADSAYLATPADMETYFHRGGWKVIALASGGSRKGRLVASVMPRYAPYLSVVAERPLHT
ncbi:class I SAM-dependent methyltransferase [Candidatus Poribacteria bacterium]|nr:class I SAM-dependent methyltransferase [Candidatus Poribacteria bacterium]MBT5535440.1 class I SAM-dependent methyltransferase [Candidatus Poribacteria bacterium]MBT5712771.1 class I SAM-dependent methyltransferase [Candidatus Poribacteria bacterium]MBT7097977.1 class I SAM-dependent methyltransferase [Candidatus Poribacteria bacterium]MBT7807703.1 class I SAM-dependent methyltransferase [Candidatus Poribacteria bacterium]